MKLEREKIRELMEIYCCGNYNRFAREIGVDPSHLYHFIVDGIGGGKKLIGGIMRFCKEKSLKFEEYIDL